MKKVYLKTLKVGEIIQRFKNGQIIKGDDGSNFYMVDGMIIYECGDRGIINAGIPKNGTYFEEEGSDFEVKKTGKYKTRDGRIAFVGFLDLIDEVRGIIEGDQHTTDWFKNGHYHGDCDGYDLVEYIGD